MDILTIIDKFNLIARIEAVAGMLFYRRAGHQFKISRCGSISGLDCELMLKQRGVRVWGGRVTSDHFIFYVPVTQARWAEHILLRGGAPVDGKRVSASNAKATPQRGLPPAWKDRR